MHATSGDKKVAIKINTPALGDTIAAIPTLRRLSKAYDNKKLTVFSSKPFLFEGHPCVDQAFDLAASTEGYKVYSTFNHLAGNRTHNLAGEEVQFRYSNMDLRQFHAVSLGFTLTEAEMEMDLYIERERELPFKNYVIVHPTHTWATRTWAQEKWQELIDRLNAAGIPVVAVGRDSKENGTYNTQKPAMQVNVRLGVNLINDPTNDPAELRWMMQNRARAVVTMDSGILHLAGTTGVNIIQLSSSIDYRLRAPYRNGSQDYKYTYVDGGCEMCSSDMASNVKVHGTIHGIPPQVVCLKNKDFSQCHPTVDQVFDRVSSLYKVRPKIRLVHLLLSDDATPERQQRSIESLKKLEEIGIEYVQVWNKRWQDTPPRENFARPEEYDTIPIRPGHYGAFRAFADATLDYFTEDLDGFILCEGDALLVKEVDEIVDAVNRAHVTMLEKDIAYFSFGSRYHLETGELQSITRNTYDDIHVVDKIIGIQMIMFTHKMRKFLKDRFIYHVWDGADIFLNNIFCNKFDMAIFEEPYAVQLDGTSTIDGHYRAFTDERSALNKEEEMQHEIKKERIVYLAPHLSTGGMPQFVLSRLRALQDQNEYEVHLVEYNQYSHAYVVQRNQIVEMLGDKFHSIGYLGTLDEKQRGDALAQILTEIEPAIIHIDECPEAFDGFNKVTPRLMDWLYSPDRPWRIVETCHNIWFDAKANKKWHPDAYAFCSPHHPDNQFKVNPGFKSVIEYPIINNKPTVVQKAAAKAQLEMDPDKVHILNVGLWTPGKNQAEGVNIAKILNELFPDKYQFHFVGNQAVNFQEYWGPIMEDVPTNVKVWGERHDTEIFYQAADAFMFNSTWECNPLAVREAIGYGLITFSRNLPQYLDMFTPYIIPMSDGLEENADIILTYLQSQEILQGDFVIPHNDMARFGQEHLDLYHGLTGLPQRAQSTSAAELRLSFDNGLKLHCDSLPAGEWHAEFIVNNAVFYRANGLQEGYWYTPSPKWWAEWQVKVYRDDSLYQTLRLDLTGQEVVVKFESNSLGDTLSWMGQMQAYKEQMGIEKLWVVTHKNWLFDQEWYRQQGIELIQDPRAARAQIQISIGVFYTNEEPWLKDRHPNDWRHQPLGKIACDQLGIDYVELRPKMAPQFLAKKEGEHKQIVIATQSTAQAKYWNNPHGWDDFTQWHVDQGYQVLHASKEGSGPEGSIQLPEPLEVVAREINSAQYFVGISSGLSWFAWALGAKVVMISGFTPEWTEFEADCLRIIKKDKCWGCWSFNTFDRGDWWWCPSHKDTARHFECTKRIEASEVIAQIIERGWA